MAISTEKLVRILNELFPAERSEPGDRVGLQIEPERDEITKVLIALDPRREVLEEGIEKQVDLILTHHPLFIKPIDKIKRGDLCCRFIQAGIGLFVAHTNFDRDYLAPEWAEIFQLENLEPFGRGEGEPYYKLVVFVPDNYRESVAEAIFSSGGGHIGNYDQASFQVQGKGTFRPLQTAKPFMGEKGRREEVKETRLETIVPKRIMTEVIGAIKENHPYEEVAYDVFPLANEPDSGLGIIGDLPQAVSRKEVADMLATRGIGEKVRWGKAEDRPRKRLALVPGKGGKLFPEADLRGAEIFISGDIDFHQFQLGQDRGVLLADPGHFALEIRGKKVMQKLLQNKIPGLDIFLAQRETCPYFYQE